jgi:hypothetical protein
MTRLNDARNAPVVALLGALLLLVAGTAGATQSGSDTPAVGRFQIACTDTVCYLVDTVTGQVWTSADPEFRVPKLSDFLPAKTNETQGYVGQWVSDDPDEDDLGLRIEPNGHAVGTEGKKSYEGRWRVEGTRIFLSIDNDELVGELQPDGCLNLCEDGDERIVFKKVP